MATRPRCVAMPRCFEGQGVVQRRTAGRLDGAALHPGQEAQPGNGFLRVSVGASRGEVQALLSDGDELKSARPPPGTLKPPIPEQSPATYPSDVPAMNGGCRRCWVTCREGTASRAGMGVTDHRLKSRSTTIADVENAIAGRVVLYTVARGTSDLMRRSGLRPAPDLPHGFRSHRRNGPFPRSGAHDSLSPRSRSTA